MTIREIATYQEELTYKQYDAYYTFFRELYKFSKKCIEEQLSDSCVKEEVAQIVRDGGAIDAIMVLQHHKKSDEALVRFCGPATEGFDISVTKAKNLDSEGAAAKDFDFKGVTVTHYLGSGQVAFTWEKHDDFKMNIVEKLFSPYVLLVKESLNTIFLRSKCFEAVSESEQE